MIFYEIPSVIVMLYDVSSVDVSGNTKSLNVFFFLFSMCFLRLNQSA